MTDLLIRAVTGLPEFRPGDDLAAAIAGAAPWLRDGDVLAVTSKVVSKVEGRVVGTPVDPVGREAARARAVDDETVRVVASRGRTRIVQTRHGFVMAAAGVDASNVRRDELALLPVDPDASARALRTRLGELLGVTVAVVVTDTTGRPWRAGLTDVAVGAAGIAALHDVRGRVDRFGNTLSLTEVAVVDEIAAAADLAKGKLDGVPVAVLSGLGYRALSRADEAARGRADRGVRPLVRDPSLDMFRLGTAEAIEVGRGDADPGRAATGPLHADIRRVVREFDARTGGNSAGANPDTVEPDRNEAIRQAYLTLLDARPDAPWRDCVPGHVTAGAVVLDPSREAVLLTLHPRIGRWVELGGHCERGDDTLAGVALREAVEEGGIEGISIDPRPLVLDIHPIVCSLGVPTRHFNASYLAIAPPGAEPTISDESLDLRWFGYDALPADAVTDLPHLIARALERLRADPTGRTRITPSRPERSAERSQLG